MCLPIEIAAFRHLVRLDHFLPFLNFQEGVASSNAWVFPKFSCRRLEVVLSIVLFSSILGGMIQFDEHIFLMG